MSGVFLCEPKAQSTNPRVRISPSFSASVGDEQAPPEPIALSHTNIYLKMERLVGKLMIALMNGAYLDER